MQNHKIQRLNGFSYSTLLRAIAASLLACACTLVPAASAQARAQEQSLPTDAYSRGESLELQSKFADAAAAYTEALARDAANLPALLGLERMDAQLGRLEQFLPVVERAITAKPQAAQIREAQLRTLRSLGKRDQLREAFERWRHDMPGDPAPARAYSRLLIADGDTRAADSVLRQAQRDVGSGRGFDYELAQLRAASGLWDLSAQSWRQAVEDNGYLDQAATFSLVIEMTSSARCSSIAASFMPSTSAHSLNLSSMNAGR